MDAMAKPLTDDEKQHIVELIQSGKGCAEIAREVGRAVDTVSRIAKTIGWTFGKTNLARAHEARSAYSSERRAELAARATEEADRLLRELHGEYMVFSFGGKDNTFNAKVLEEPPIEAKRAMIQGFRELIRTVIDIDRHDSRNDEGASAVDEWLRGIVGDAVAA